MNSFRFIDDPARAGALNMAIDDLLARQAGNAGALLVFRLYSWCSPVLSIGFHQRLERRVNLESCHRNKVEVVRRPTGGRELLHDGDLSFSVTGAVNSEAPDKIQIKGFFEKVGRVILGGLEGLGITAVLINGTRKMANGNLQPCLVAPSQYEIVSDGKKIAPMAQRVYPGSALVHGSIPLVKPGISTADLLKVKDGFSLQKQIDESSTSLFQLLGKQVDVKKLKKCLLGSFQDVFDSEVKNLKILRRELVRATDGAFNWEIEINRVNVK